MSPKLVQVRFSQYATMILQYTLPYFRQQRVEFSRARRALPPNVSRKMKYLPSTWRSLRFQQSHSKVNSPRLSREWTHSTGSPEVDKARMELAEDLVWARSATSRLLLSQPPFLEEDFGNNGTALDSLDAYLKVKSTIPIHNLALSTRSSAAPATTFSVELSSAKYVQDDGIRWISS